MTPDIDWDEAQLVERHRQALAELEAKRTAVVEAAWPVGTRVRWRQVPRRAVFEAEGVVDGRCVGARADVVWVRFTKHPVLATESEWVHRLPVEELERL